MELLKKKPFGYLATSVRNIPFSAEILESELPKNFKFPHVGEYDGKGDPEEHLSRFENAALLHKYSDTIKCRVFLNTLIGPAQQWFNLLRSGDIKEFKDFSKAFLHHFASSKKHPQPLSVFSLSNSKSSTYDELLARAEKYVILEEIQVSRLNRGIDKPPSPKDTMIPNTPRKMGPTPRPELLGQFTSFTPLRMSKTQALRICEEKRLLQRPPWSEQGPRKPKSDKYCDFHNEYGHLTNDCRQLEQEIERIIQQDEVMKDILVVRQGGRYRPEKRDRDGPDHSEQKKRGYGTPNT
ncbi:uncharacterized protein [Henckelia pumila]|uniref:uncharacterized protein n=1 Tax=Henckelia pumila TaxID=405737 RepID=UPI003C6E7AEB